MVINSPQTHTNFLPLISCYTLDKSQKWYENIYLLKSFLSNVYLYKRNNFTMDVDNFIQLL